MPGTQWAPAWVAWRGSDDYLAWAPLPPGRGSSIDIGISIGDVPDYYWQGVPNSAFLSANLSDRIVRDDRRYLRDTRPLGNVTVVNNTVVNNVVNVQYVEQKTEEKVVVHETGQVNELAVENVSADADVFIQSGDIVKGGRQDRMIAQDFVVPARSGKMPIASFCVEQGRWSRRGSEQSHAFAASSDQVAGKALKMAAHPDGIYPPIVQQRRRVGARAEGNLHALGNWRSVLVFPDRLAVLGIQRHHVFFRAAAAHGEKPISRRGNGGIPVSQVAAPDLLRALFRPRIGDLGGLNLEIALRTAPTRPIFRARHSARQQHNHT